MSVMSSGNAVSLTNRNDPGQRIPGQDGFGPGPDSGDREPTTTSVSKALHLLDSFRDAGPCPGVSELARRAGVPKSTAFRLLAYLEQGGYVERSGKGYRLGWRLFELGNGVQHCRPRGLRDVAVPHLSDLYVRTGQVVHLAVLEGGDVVYLEKIHGLETPPTPTNVGGRIPASCSGLGKAILAFTDEQTVRGIIGGGLVRRTPYSIAEPGRLMSELGWVRENGVAYDRQEAALGLACVAAPILVNGRAIAAVSVSGRTTRFNPATTSALVRRAATGITTDYHP